MSTPAGPPAERPSTASRETGALPRAVLVSIGAWVLYAVVLVYAWLARDDGPGAAADESVGRIRDTLGPSSVASGPGNSLFLIVPLIAVVVVLLLFGLFLRKGWIVWPLTVVGIAGVLVLASGGAWQTLLAMPLVAVGAVALMTAGARRYLAS